MKHSICVKCGGDRFEVRDSQLKQKGSRVVFVQCSDCGGVVGAFELRKGGKLTMKDLENSVAVTESSNIEL